MVNYEETQNLVNCERTFQISNMLGCSSFFPICGIALSHFHVQV